ncbi:MAG: helix-turn-helix domain-containing protein, partial [Lachnospiraceae bacterium]|nr:helix-turn-helix domain-containing protein [Lachnospiraceae bacterium]
LIITDIQMPHMDGLTLLLKSRKFLPDLHCILLTAYGEFEYAMQALKLGVDNYLMKPVQIQELTETIENTLDNIYNRRKNQATLFRENILLRWIAGSISSEELGERAAYADLNIWLPAYCVLILKKYDTVVSISAFGQECIRKMPKNLETMSVWNNNGEYLILIGGDNINVQELYEIIKQTAADSHILHKITAAIGSIVHEHTNVHMSFHEATELLNTNTAGMIRFASEKLSNQKECFGTDISEMKYSPVIIRTIAYVNEHYSEGVSIKEFCAGLNINAAYLGYLFKKETGLYFNTYLNQVRMKKAAELLCHSSEKINDIARMVGFATTSYFISSFKKITGLSPLKYRETHTGTGTQEAT